MIKPKRWMYDWRVILALILYFVNIEFFIIPVILIGWLSLEGLTLGIVAGIWGFGEKAYWVWFSGWLTKEIKKAQPVTDAIIFGKSIAPKIRSEVKGMRSFQETHDWAKDYFTKRFSVENYKNNKLFIFSMQFLRWSGYFFGCILIFFIGLIPLAWIVGLVICRVKNWKLGFAALLVGAFMRSFGFAYGWEGFFSFTF